jgi:polar amino acid transport system substrate-binding protein
MFRMRFSFYKKQMMYLITILMAAYSILSHAEAPLEKVSLQLDWKYQFEFAGFIMAKEKGFYKDVGLDVELREYKEGVDIVDSVLSRQSNYGIYNSSVVVSDGKLKPTILMATYYQKSPLIFVTSKDIKQPSDLVGKRIMGTTDELKYSSLALMLDHFFINNKNANFLEHSFNINDFIDHKVDAMSAFRTNQLFELDQLNIPYNIIDPADYGFSMSAVNLFTSYSEALSHPERSRQFIDASNKGWAYALAHPQETIDVIYNHYSKEKSLEALTYEAEVTRKMMLLDFFDIGATNKELTIRAVNQLQYSGLLAKSEKLGTFIFQNALSEFGSGIHFTDEQKQYLENKKELHLCIDPDWMPFEAIKDGKYIGITSDVISKFQTQLPIPITLVPTKDWSETISKGKSRQCDMFALAAKTTDRAEYMDFTKPYIDIPVVMATKTDTFFINDIEEVKNKKIGVVKNYAIADQLRNRTPDINIVDVASVTDGLARVESGELYGYVDNLMVIANSIQRDFTGVLKISLRLDDNIKLAMASRNDEPELHQVLVQLVDNLSEAELQAIYNTWVAAVENNQLFDYSYAWKLFAIIFLILSGYVFHYIKLKKLNNSLLTLSITDKLTGLYNRVKTDEVLAEKKAEVDRYHTELSVILLDIDFFKLTNDNYGHLTGDKVLIEFAQIIKQNIRTTDYVGRWGGEEFLIICPNIGITDTMLLANKLITKIRNHTFSEVINITASAGVSVFTAEKTIDATIHDADQALYQSKENGRDQVTAFNPDAVT